MFKLFISRLCRPFSTFLGYKKIQSIRARVDKQEWIRGFKYKKVLIVGTGPSLDKVEKSFFNSFDSVVYINHAVKIARCNNNEFFFTTDITVLKNIQSKVYYNSIISFGSERSIVAPIHFQDFLGLKTDFVKSFTWLSASKAKINIVKGNTFKGRVFPLIKYWPEQLSESQLSTWFASENQVDYFPVVESTSALSAILFIAKYKPESISLIGCDFSSGRSGLVVNECPASKINVFSESRSKYIYIRKYLSFYDIPVNNYSWD